MKDSSQLETTINYSFRDENLLKEALTHRSYLNENPSWGVPHNERLEFLGDAVLELAVSKSLFLMHKDYSEGQLTSFRAALVNAHMLSKVAKEVRLESAVLLSRGEARDSGRARGTILANTVEALIGAIYLDGDFDAAYAFVENFIVAKHLTEVTEEQLWKDPKSKLQEVVQEKLGVTPRYAVLEEWGPDHQKTFRVGVYFNERLIAEGEGFSKQEAELDAARGALEQKEV